MQVLLNFHKKFKVTCEIENFMLMLYLKQKIEKK